MQTIEKKNTGDPREKRARERRDRTLQRRRSVLLAALAAALVLLIAGATMLLRSCGRREGPAPEAAEEDPVIWYHNSALPILESVPASGLNAEAFAVDENGWLRYRSAPVGVDVSSHQGTIDWALVKGAGVDFTMIRAGRRGYTEGGLFADKTFEDNFAGAKAAGLDVGVYFFSQAIDEKEAREEAKYLLALLEGRELTYPVAYDWEPIDDDEARTDAVSSETLTACARAFCETVAAAGYQTAIYFNVDQGYLDYRLDELTDHAFWLAEYHEKPEFYYRYDFLQYTHQGSVPGIEGAVDMDLDLRYVP